MKNYYENFKNKNVDKIKEKSVCKICSGSYTYFNKSSHTKTKKHLNCVEMWKKFNIII